MSSTKRKEQERSEKKTRKEVKIVSHSQNQKVLRSSAPKIFKLSYFLGYESKKKKMNYVSKSRKCSHSTQP